MNNLFTFKATEHKDQNNLFTPEHKKYRITLKTAKGWALFDYQQNRNNPTPTAADVVPCLLLDYSAIDYCPNLWNFLEEYGYNQTAELMKEGIQAYNTIKRNIKKLDRLFTPAELDELRTIYEEG